jgi:uracil-xanthine permease
MSEAAKPVQGWVVYPIGSKPPWGLSILLGIQQYLTMFGATIIIPFVVADAIGMPIEEKALLISTMFFVSGITTLLQQSPIGNRLPIVQGGTFSFLGPMFAIAGMVAAEKLGWQIAIQQISAAVMFGSVFEILFGYIGLFGLLRKLFSPIVIGPTIAMIGLNLFGIGAPWMAGNWVVSGITLVALILYSQVFGRKSKVFMLFPVLLAVLTGWIAAIIGTAAGWIDPANAASVAGKGDLIAAAPWFSLRPLVPFKWGFPQLNSITLAGSIGMLAGYLASMIESIGDYHSCARISEAPVPTAKMISKGLGAEGIGCLIASIFQTGNGTTSYSENIGSIGLTRVASRRVIRMGALVMLFLPLFGKFGATLATLPQPVVGSMFVGMFGLIAAVGLSNLQFVNMNNSRNLFIIGLGLFTGLSIPAWANAAAMPWTSPVGQALGNMLWALMRSGMAVTAVVTMVLDNILPGATTKERGLDHWQSEASEEAWVKAEAEWAKIKS